MMNDATIAYHHIGAAFYMHVTPEAGVQSIFSVASSDKLTIQNVSLHVYTY